MARLQHYLFAHRVLPDLFSRDPLQMLAALKGPDGPERLRRLWEEVGKGAPPEERVAPDGLTCSDHELSRGLWCPTLVVVMPPTANVGEAILAAAVLAGGPRYFTLEHGLALPEGAPRTVLCEWRAGSHLNYGDGPPADVTAFLQAVEDKVNE